MRVQIKVVPGSKNSSVEEKDGEIIVRVKAPPEKGKANKEAVRLLEIHFGKKVRIVSGHTSRKKIIEISD